MRLGKNINLHVYDLIDGASSDHYVPEHLSRLIDRGLFSASSFMISTFKYTGKIGFYHCLNATIKLPYQKLCKADLIISCISTCLGLTSSVSIRNQSFLSVSSTSTASSSFQSDYLGFEVKVFTFHILIV